MKYKVHRFDIDLDNDQDKLEQFLNSLEGEVISMVPNIKVGWMAAHRVNFLLIIEKLG